jgi:hypothetical protein
MLMAPLNAVVYVAGKQLAWVEIRAVHRRSHHLTGNTSRSKQQQSPDVAVNSVKIMRNIIA